MTFANAIGTAQFSAPAPQRDSSPPPDAHAPFPLRAALLAQAIAIATLLLLAQLPLLVKFFADLWSRPQYQFYPVALLAAGYVAFDRLRDAPLGERRRGSLSVTIVLLATAWLVLCGGLMYLRWMAPVSAWLTLAAAVWWVGGRRLARILLPAGILLLVIIPPPAHMDELLGARLRLLAVHASGRLLDLLSVPHVLNGAVIEIPGHRLLVEEACSGINSLMSVIAFSLLYGFWQRRRALMIVGLTLAAAGFVLCANIVRITLGAVLVQYWHVNILEGSAHETLGMVLFAVSLGLVLSFDCFLMRVFPGERSAVSSAPPQSAGGVLRRLFSPLAAGRSAAPIAWWSAAVAFLALGALLQLRVGRLWASPRIGDDAGFSLPVQLAGWQRLPGDGALNGRPETDGRQSTFWLYRRGDLTAGVAVTYPFSGFHDATICYASSGWTIDSRAAQTPAGQPQDAFHDIHMSKAPMMIGEMLFAQIDEKGHAPPVPAPHAVGGLGWALYLSKQKALAPATYQVQTLSIGFKPLTPAQRLRLHRLFQAARSDLARQVVSKAEGGR